jgi:UDP-2-acetamido-3-amino-2,3-dideoxy-glucuronate N-acetyltransferase
MKETKQIALLGVGGWGKNIYRNLHEMGLLASVYDSDKSVMSALKDKANDLKFASSVDEIEKDDSIRAVVIVTPASTHYELTKRMLLAGKDIFVEKPLALNAAEGEELVALAHKKNKILMVGHILQYHPAVRKLKKMIDDGELGKIRYIYSNRLNIGKLRTEENILWSFAPHDISVILELTGEEPIKVTAYGGDYISPGLADVTMTALEFKNGVKGHIFVSWLHPYKEQKLIVVGSKAMAVFDDVSKEKLFIYPHTIEWKEGKIPVAQKADYKVVPVEEGEPLKMELEHFIDCVATRKKPRTDGEEGLRVLKILERAQKGLTPAANSGPRGESMSKNYYVHDTACVDANVELGEGTKVWHFSHVQSGAKIGKKCVLGQNVNIANNVTIGNFVKIQNNVSVYEGVTLEDYVFCGPSMVFTNIVDPRSKYPQVGAQYYIKTLVKEGASLGANSTIVCGHNVGRFAFVGAGSVVTKDVPDFALVVGNPARIVGWMSEAGRKLKFDDKGYANCDKSKKKYRLENGIVKEVL